MLSLAEIRTRAERWLSKEFNEETRKEVREMLEKDEKSLLMHFTRILNLAPAASEVSWVPVQTG